jgi:hypothetical protein
LTGLLIKNATITVKYSSADLDKLGGDASKLKLARWDEAQDQWTVLKTKVDTQTTALSADTNQFSIWAVVSGGAAGSTPGVTSSSTSPQASGTNLGLIIGIVAAVVIIVLLIYFLLIRRRSAH